MEVKPLADKRKPKPVAVVLGAGIGGVTVAVDGEYQQAARGAASAALLRRLEHHCVYTVSRPTELLRATDARWWTGFLWAGGALTKLRLDAGPTIYPLRAITSTRNMDAREVAVGIIGLTNWLATYGVNPGSLSSMAWRLWRATLPEPVRLYGPPVRPALYGGRQEAPYPGDYHACRYYDLSAAYPASMADAPYPGRLIRVKTTTRLEGVGVARASVVIPSMEWCPLPVRVGKGALCYGWGAADGWWTYRELALARDVGCVVTIHESYAGVRELDLFGPWWATVREGRRLAGSTGALVKAVTSRLWGAFALEDEGGAVVRWRDKAGRRPVRVRQVRRASLPTANAVYVAADTTARVRDRLYREALAGGADVLYVDTDGIIGGDNVLPDNVGAEPGQWRVKAQMVRCEIRAPQVLRHTCPRCNADHAAWHYTVAGAPSTELAARLFDRTKRHRGEGIASLQPGQVTLPRGPLAKYADG